jgi:acetyl esterase/lipase
MASDAFQDVVAALRDNPIDPQASVAELRAWLEPTAAPEGVSATPVDAGGVAAEWVVADGADGDRRVLYLHGGGYVIGNLDSHREIAGRISITAGVAVLLLDYRLAPEHPFPAAVEDARAALRWVQTNGPGGAGAATATFVAGDSAGGGLVISTLVSARDAGDVLPDAAVTLSAWADLECTAASMETRADADPMVTKEVLLRMTREYIQDGDASTPLASPIHSDLTGLPPLLLIVGDAEVLLDDSTRLAERAKAAGVDVTLDVWPEMFHIFPVFAGVLPEGQQAIERIGEFLKQRAATTV